jgi:hypothetical protein
MKRWALVVNSTVDMITEQDSEPVVFTSSNAFWVDVTNVFVGPGWLYIDGQFLPPSPPEEPPAE